MMLHWYTSRLKLVQNILQHVLVRSKYRIWYKEGADVSVPITTKVVSSNPEVYLMQQYVIQFVSDLRQVGGFQVLYMFVMLEK
jgi:hypothetical protein